MRKQRIPTNAISFFDTESISFPTISVTGMTTRHGIEIRFCIIVCEASGKCAPIAVRAPEIPITPIISIPIPYIPIFMRDLFSIIILLVLQAGRHAYRPPTSLRKQAEAIRKIFPALCCLRLPGPDCAVPAAASSISLHSFLPLRAKSVQLFFRPGVRMRSTITSATADRTSM